MPATYKLKCGCVNCGMVGFYYVPQGAEFWGVDTETSVPHSYDPSFLEMPDESRKDLKCRNCGFACLGLEYWDEQPKAEAKAKLNEKVSRRRG